MYQWRLTQNAARISRFNRVVQLMWERMRRHRKRRRILLLLLTAMGSIACASCVTIPQAYKEVAGNSGIQANRLDRFAGFEFVTNTAFVAGNIRARTSPRRRVACSNHNMAVSVLWADRIISETDAEHACQWVLRAVGYVAAYAHDDPRVTSIRYRLFLVPDGQAAEMHGFSWRPLGHLRPFYVAHWLDDPVRTEASVVGTLAHEAFHLDMFALGANGSSEGSANLVGACARLGVIGRIDRRNYQNGVPREMADFSDKQLNPSMMAAGALAAKMAPLFNRDGLILAGSKAGRTFSTTCSNELTKLFRHTAT